MGPVNREKTPDRAVGSLGHLGYLTQAPGNMARMQRKDSAGGEGRRRRRLENTPQRAYPIKHWARGG